MLGNAMSDSQKVILVDNNDNQIGVEDKLSAHQNGARLHRAFSVFIFNSKAQTLLQQRASTKYHAPLIWANACCSHPYPGEDTLTAAHRRLREELGMDCDLDEVFSFIYKAPVGNNLVEWEYDHVFFGLTDEQPQINKAEVETFEWVSMNKLTSVIEADSKNYAPWLRMALDRVKKKYEEYQKKKPK